MRSSVVMAEISQARLGDPTTQKTPMESIPWKVGTKTNKKDPKVEMGVSRGTPKWMVYNGKPY